MIVAFLSGGKDSYYAVYRYGGSVDLGVMLVYEFPRPSPHLLNLGKSVETILLTGIPVAVVRLTKGREFLEKASFLRKIGADKIIAGDVYIEDHLMYMERLAKSIGASLIEPLWGLDPAELLYKELEDGLGPLVIGSNKALSRWVGVELNLGNVDSFIEEARRLGVDPLGERGEYHTIVVSGPLHRSRLSYRILSTESYGDYIVLRLV